MILVVRTLHGVITAFFLSCMGILWYAAITGEIQLWGWAAAAFLVIEGLVVLLNGGNCPLGRVHHRYGDDRAFFELLLPPRAAKLAVPLLGVVSVVGIILLFL